MHEKIQQSLEILAKENIDFDIKNNGIHVILTDFKGEKIDFWPTTGKYKPRNDVASSGINNLLRYIKATKNV